MTDRKIPDRNDAEYYQHAGRLPFASRISGRARRAVYRDFIAACAPGPATVVLDLGVSLEVSFPEVNMLEQLYPHRARLVCAGLGDGAAVTAAYPGVRYVRVTPHQPLPFRDAEFPVAFCNAVLEHAGTRDQQAALVAELCRIAETVFLVVPNRWFPIEPHTGLPLIHWLPLRLFRHLLRPTPLRFWADPEHLNPLTARALARMIPAGRRAVISACGLGPAPFASNLAACIRRVG